MQVRDIMSSTVVSGMLLGSTSQALIHHATCPLVVVRPDAA